MSGDDVKVADRVVLRSDAGGLPAGSSGVVIGFYTNEPQTVLVRFDEVDEPVRVPPASLAHAS